MQTSRADAVEPVARQPVAGQAEPTDLELSSDPAADRPQRARDRLAATLGAAGWPVAVYCASRLLLLTVASVVAVVTHHSLANDAFLFDGRWYLRLTEHGYPVRPLHAKSTLGFFPLYPLVVRAVAWVCVMPVPQAALVTSIAGGLAAALLVQRLAAAWWGEQAARRAVLVVCLFPGSIVFSMAYSECLTIPLAVGCLLALRSRRWLIAGLLAGLATAVEPVALVLIPVCAAAAVAQVRSLGWRDPAARRSVAAPLLAPLGIAGLAVFLWTWTGTPFAAYLAQHYGWHQQSEPLALLALPVARHLLSQPAQLVPRIFAWNIWNGILGGVFLGFSVRALLRVRGELSVGALMLPAGIAALTLWSIMTPPNARMALVAFPAIMVWGRRLSGRAFGLFVAVEVLVLVLTSALTFSAHMLP